MRKVRLCNKKYSQNKCNTPIDVEKDITEISDENKSESEEKSEMTLKNKLTFFNSRIKVVFF